MKRLVFLAGLLVVGAAQAQESPNFKLDEHTLNAGGTPRDGAVIASAGFRLTLASIGAAVREPGMSSASFRFDAGFAAAYPPPGEVHEALFLDQTLLAWSPERSAGRYHLYRGTITSPFDPGFGACLPPPVLATQASVGGVPAPGEAHFILVTSENRLGEEGTKGFTSALTERPNPVPCP